MESLGRNLLRPISCFSLLLLLLLLFFHGGNGFHKLHTVTVDVGNYYHAHVLRTIPEKVESGEELGMQALYKNRRLTATTGACTSKDLSISQSPVTSHGIPEFVVEIGNTCLSGCSPSQIHLHCGWFASANLVNPNLFKRLKYDDCLVNGGKPLKSSQIIRFQYSNTFLYPLSFKSASFC